MADKGLSVAVIGIVGVVISAYLYQTGFFTSADIRFQRQANTDDPCPSSLNTYAGDFELSFSNVGNRGADVSAELKSPDNVSFIKNKDSVNIVAGRDSTLKFIINSSSLKKADYVAINNATISISANYTANSRGEVKTTTYVCKYKGEGSSLTLLP